MSHSLDRHIGQAVEPLWALRQWRRRLTLLGMPILALIIGIGLGTPGWADSPHSPIGQHTQEFELSDVLRLALERHPLLAAREGVIAEQEGRHRATLAYPNPTVSVQVGRGSVRDPSVGISIIERYVTLSQPVEWPGMRAADQEAARAGVAGAQAMLAETTLTLAAEVKQAFYRLLLAQRQRTLLAKNLATVRHLAHAVGRRIRAGEVPAFEGVKMAVEVQSGEKALTQANGAVQAARVALNTLTAGALGQEFSVRGEFPSPPLPMDSERLIQQALREHPHLLRLRYLVEEGQQLKIREEQARIPTLRLEGSYQRDAGREAVVGNLSLPFPIWNQRQGDIAQALGALRQREARLLLAEQDLTKSIHERLQQVNIALAQLHAYEEGFLRQAREALRLATVSFKFGDVSVVEVLDAQRQYRQALLDYAQTHYELAVALAELERLVGKSL